MYKAEPFYHIRFWDIVVSGGKRDMKMGIVNLSAHSFVGVMSCVTEILIVTEGIILS